jgi:hypothetical protein
MAGPIFQDRPRRIVGDDPHNIIPRGVSHGAVIPLDLQVRLTTEYDVRYMQDRIRADVFINRQSTGIYSVAAIDDREFGYGPDGLLRAMERYGPDLQRAAIDEFVGYNLRRKVSDLETQNNHLARRIGDLEQRSRSTDRQVKTVTDQVFRPRLHQRAALKIASWFL